MRTYLELYEILPPDSIEESDFIRIDITEWSRKDVDEAIQLLRQHASESYSNYILQLHYCYHDEGKPCSTTVIESK